MKKTYILENDIFGIDVLLNEIKSEISDVLSVEESKELMLGVYEMILNAIEHGNLGITYEMKKQWLLNNSYEENIKNLSEKVTNTKVTVVLIKKTDEIIITIKDCGNGFDFSKQIENQNKDNILRENGRGIIIAKHFFTEVSYNSKGNEVTLKKKISEQ